ncbi:MAG: hypothetical protein ABI983_09885, partial [Acidobacteriota bacterium]
GLGVVGGVVRLRRSAEKVIKARESSLRTSYSQIRRLAGRLLHAQETARSGIARDLHHDFCQKLALVGIGITSLKKSPAGVQAGHHRSRELSNRDAGRRSRRLMRRFIFA